MRKLSNLHAICIYICEANASCSILIQLFIPHVTYNAIDIGTYNMSCPMLHTPRSTQIDVYVACRFSRERYSSITDMPSLCQATRIALIPSTRVRRILTLTTRNYVHYVNETRDIKCDFSEN